MPGILRPWRPSGSSSRSATAWSRSATRIGCTSPPAARPSSTWPTTTSRWPTGSSTPSTTGPACCTASRTGSTGRRCTRSGCRTEHRRGSRRSGCTSRASTGTPTSSASAIRPTSSGRCRCPPSSSIPGTPAGTTPSRRTSGGSTSIRCRLAGYADVRRVASIVRELLDELGAVGYPKTSGGKGLHVYVRIPPEHGFADVRRAAWAFAREVERRADGLVDLTWWRKDRDPGSDLRGLQPERPRPHDRLRLLGARHAARAWSPRPVTWDEIARRGPPGLHHRHRPGAVRRDRRPARRHRRSPVPAGHPAGMGRARRTSRHRPGAARGRR